MRLFRWKAIVPLLLFCVLLTVFWLFWVDHVIRRTIEFAGSELVGARVELASARIRLRRADLVLRGLQVTDPYRPMTNLFETPEIVADLNGRALLSKKAVIETLAVRELRFGTPRRTSGALDDPGPKSGLVTRRVLGWARSITIPELNLEGLLGAVVSVDAISADSLRTPRQAQVVQAMGDSLRASWEAQARGLDPSPQLDSARALVTELQARDPRRMSPAEVAATANRARTAAQRVQALTQQVNALKASVEGGLGGLRAEVARIDEARRADYAYARGLLNIPSLAAPDISMSLFGEMAVERLKPVLHWVGIAEQYLPPGLDPRRDSGPERLRLSGTTYRFPLAHAWPAFLLERGEADLAIGGQTVAAGSYVATVTGATTEPAVYGRPMHFAARRRSSVGPRELDVSGMMDRVGAPKDSVAGRVGGVTLPPLSIPKAGAALDFGPSTVDLALVHAAGGLSGWWRLTADTARWNRTAAAPATPPRLGTREWAEDLLWRSLSSVPRVTIEARVGGTLQSPTLAVSSNVGEQVAANLGRALGAEIARAEAQARAQVDRVVNEQVERARAQLAAVEQRLAAATSQVQQLEQVKGEIDAQVQRLTSQVPAVRLPSLPGVRRP